MRPIRRIDYFDKQRKKALKTINFSWEVFQLLHLQTYKYKKTKISANKYKVEIFDVSSGNPKRIARVFCKDNRIMNCSFKGNSKYLYAIAIRYNWLKIPPNGLPVTQWKYLDEEKTKRWRINFCYNKLFIEYRDKYGKKMIDIDNVYQIADSIFDLQKEIGSNCQKSHVYSTVMKIVKLTKLGDARWFNLKPFRSVDFSRKYRNAFRLS